MSDKFYHVRNVKFYHVRDFGLQDRSPIATAAISRSTEDSSAPLFVGMSFRSNKDKPYKKRGREVAEARMLYAPSLFGAMPVNDHAPGVYIVTPPVARNKGKRKAHTYALEDVMFYLWERHPEYMRRGMVVLPAPYELIEKDIPASS